MAPRKKVVTEKVVAALIVAGPSKHDLLVKALGNREFVEFALNVGRRQVIIDTVCVGRVEEDWFISGRVSVDETITTDFCRFEGCYSTRLNRGVINIRDNFAAWNTSIRSMPIVATS